MERLIYKVTNLVNNKIYIGQTKNLKERQRTHLKSANGTRSNMIFHKAIRKYGIDNFKWEILYKGEELIDEIEVYFIHYFNSHCSNGYGYNCSYGKSNKGFKHSEEYKLNLSIRMEGNTINLGRKRSPEEIERLRLYNLGSKRTEEVKARMNKDKIKQFIYEFTNHDLIFKGTLYEFANTYNLDRSNLNKLVQGKSKQYKGWFVIQNK